ncbi:alkaline phosphatase [bacterium]|nr:MAG: alkaline phosphatase [bacterium]
MTRAIGRSGRRWATLCGAAVAATALLAGFSRCVSAETPRSMGGDRPTAPDHPASTVTLAVIGDYGTADANALAVATLIGGWNPDFILAVGDDYYGAAGEPDPAKRYDRSTGQYYCAFLKDVTTTGSFCPSGLAAVNRFFPALGNHDYSDAGVGAYLGYFSLPGAGIPGSGSSGSERYYDFLRGPAHFFVVDSDEALRNATDRAAQQAWLQAQLAASSAKWKVVYFHHPPYSSSSFHGSTPGMQWPFAAWGADLVLAGHDHTYERIQLGDGVTYLVAGLGGAPPYGFGAPVAGSQARYNSLRGALRLTVTDAAVDGRFVSVDGVEQDAFHLDDTPMAVVLDRLAGRRLGAAVEVSWSTAAEMDHAGFRVIRQPASSGPEAVLTPVLIAARGTAVAGARYRFVDRDAPAAAVRYWIDAIDTQGQTERHGPVAVRAAPAGRAAGE